MSRDRLEPQRISPVAVSQCVLGTVLPEVIVTPQRTDFVRFAGAGGDFNPVHHDEPYARALGHPSVFAMGMWTASIAARTLTDFFGPGVLREYRVRFVGRVWPDEPLHFRAEVEGRHSTVVEDVVEVSLTVAAGGETKMTAKAIVAAPLSARADFQASSP